MNTELSRSVSERLDQLHTRLLETIPNVDRIGCAIYDPAEDTLKTFVNSTRTGQAISAYQYKLSDSKSLSELARTGSVRVIDDIQAVFKPANTHSSWLLEQGYRSSFTVPLFDQGDFLGFVFYDSREVGVFTPPMQRNLILFSNLINMTLTNEFALIRSVKASVNMARDFTNHRDFETGAHLERMARNCRVIARAIAAKYNLSDEFIEYLYLFAPLHDIGKIGIPDQILLKPGPLNPQEREVMRSHVQQGVEIAENILRNFRLSGLADSKIMIDVIAHHHEFLDGSGYPSGLAGHEVPIAARIVAVADILDALVSVRPYKEAWTVAAAISELKKMAALGKLDSDCVEAVEAHQDEIQHIVDKYKDTHDQDDPQ